MAARRSIIDRDIHPAPDWERVADFLAEPWPFSAMQMPIDQSMLYPLSTPGGA